MLSVEPHWIIDRGKSVAGCRSILDECSCRNISAEVDQRTGITFYGDVDVRDLSCGTRGIRNKVVEDDLAGRICFYLKSATFDLKVRRRRVDIRVPGLGVLLRPCPRHSTSAR